MNASSKSRNPIIVSTSSDLSPAAEVITNNIDLLTEILLCVPAKTLIRFKSVSKHWLSLITDFHFATRHSRQNPRPSISALFLYWYEKTGNPKSVSLQGDPTRLTLDFLSGLGFAEIEIIHSCNGLLLCRYLPIFSSTNQYLVCNPTTQTYSLIPEPPEFSYLDIPPVSRVLLVFDPLKSPGYKVVFMIYAHDQIDIYSSESASWKQIPALSRGFRHEVFCRRVIHWLSDYNVAFGFDVESEKIREMPKLPDIHSLSEISYFGECGGRLILIKTHPPSELEIFEMDKDFCHWVVKFKVDLGLISEMEEPTIIYYSVPYVVLALPGKVMSYNLNCKTWNVLRVSVHGETLFRGHPYATAYPYIESLSPL